MHFDERKIKLYSEFIEPTFLKNFLNKTQTAALVPATVGKIINGQYTATYDKWCTAKFIHFDLFKNDVNYIVDKMKVLVEKEYNVLCTNPEINFLSYADGESYVSHIDGQVLDENIVKRVTERDITCVFYLNDEYEGGEVFFNFFNKSFKPNANELLIYPTTWEYMHGVKPVTGQRYALVVWFTTLPHLNIESKITNKIVLNQLISYLKQT